MVNTGQYESEWSIENSKGRFYGGLSYLYRFYVLSIEKRKKRALFMVIFPSQNLSTEFCITVQVPNISLSCIIKGKFFCLILIQELLLVYDIWFIIN